MSEWLGEDGRRAAALLGPIEIGKGVRITFSTEPFAWTYRVEDFIAKKNVWKVRRGVDQRIGDRLQNDHARARLAEKGVCVQLCDKGKYRVEQITTETISGGWLADGEFIDIFAVIEDGKSPDEFDSYEDGAIAATRAVYGGKK